ncbi:11350_t:CDS:2 [Ambispora gerdemannii]|uniref:mannan endo-1,4-beta-mannosidase n=1 Tax=Ambispora gerdemannii TaxID=144530 RepID=A0A9N9GIK6_9GLOM|nr:11350_t:CDS:2 [Ambispora gerdemannii]
MSKYELENYQLPSSSPTFPTASFVKVNGTSFEQNGKPLFLTGANYWQAMNLGMAVGGNRTRVLADLAKLKEYGVNNIRVMAASEGPPGEPYRMYPALMNSPGEYDENVFEGLDWFLDQLEKYGMTATMTLSNYWHWSGGFAQYVNWAENGKTPIPYPKGPDFEALEAYAARFYSDPTVEPRCQEIYRNLVHTVVTRRNTINGKLYRDDPVILTWELANEPQAIKGSNAHDIIYKWIDSSAAFIKSLDSNHLVSTGAEGKNGKEWFVTMHTSENIDFASAHVWVENWGYYNSSDPSAENFEHAKQFMLNFLQDASNWSTNILKKPVYLAEYGMARDGWTKTSKYDPAAPVTNKNKYYKALADKVFELEKEKAFSGHAFWAYSGIARPSDPAPQWLGDPPHESPGWYGVYDSDKETLEIIGAHARQVEQLLK